MICMESVTNAIPLNHIAVTRTLIDYCSRTFPSCKHTTRGRFQLENEHFSPPSQNPFIDYGHFSDSHRPVVLLCYSMKDLVQ